MWISPKLDLNHLNTFFNISLYKMDNFRTNIIDEITTNIFYILILRRYITKIVFRAYER